MDFTKVSFQKTFELPKKRPQTKLLVKKKKKWKCGNIFDRRIKKATFNLRGVTISLMALDSFKKSRKGYDGLQERHKDGPAAKSK